TSARTSGWITLDPFGTRTIRVSPARIACTSSSVSPFTSFDSCVSREAVAAAGVFISVSSVGAQAEDLRRNRSILLGEAGDVVQYVDAEGGASYRVGQPGMPSLQLRGVQNRLKELLDKGLGSLDLPHLGQDLFARRLVYTYADRQPIWTDEVGLDPGHEVIF